MSGKIRIVCLLVLVCLFFGCVGTPEWETIEPYIETDISENGILKLEFDPTESDATEKLLYDSITKELFIDNDSESYGYYHLKLDYKEKHSMTITKILFPLAIYGVPTDKATFQLNAKFCIFNSEGELIKEYTDENIVKQKSGLIIFYPYGTDPSKKIASGFNSMLKNIFSSVKMDTKQINRALEESGIVTMENYSQAKSSIAEYHENCKQTVSMENLRSVSTIYYDENIDSSSEYYYEEMMEENIEKVSNEVTEMFKSMQDSFEQAYEDYTGQSFLMCNLCKGSGQCYRCEGKGTTIYGTGCFVCQETGSCSTCGGDGIIN